MIQLGPYLRYLWQCLLVALVLAFPVSAAWNLPFPGGSSVSFEDGVLRIGTSSGDNSECQIPPKDTVIQPSILNCIKVKDTGHPMKGYGAFCEQYSIPKHTFLGFYSGKRIVRDLNKLDQPLLSSENSNNAGEYLLSLDGGVTFLDGYERAQNRSIFNPVHLNHKDKSDEGCNCFRLAEKETVAFFTSRDILIGEELCCDYGGNYWRGRESDKI